MVASPQIVPSKGCSIPIRVEADVNLYFPTAASGRAWLANQEKLYLLDQHRKGIQTKTLQPKKRG